MKIVNPTYDVLTQTIRLYTELCQVAEHLHQMGPESGAKRTIVLHLYFHGDTELATLASEYPLPAARGAAIIGELNREGFVAVTTRDERTVLTLTTLGRSLAERLLRAEAELFRQSSVALPLANCKEAAATLQIMTEVMKNARDARPMLKVSGFR